MRHYRGGMEEAIEPFDEVSVILELIIFLFFYTTLVISTWILVSWGILQRFLLQF